MRVRNIVFIISETAVIDNPHQWGYNPCPMATDDKILLTGARFFGHHGVSDEERRIGGRFVVDVELTFDLARAGATDDLSHTISYADVYDVVAEMVQKKSFQLVEALAENIAQALFRQFPATRVMVRVFKQPPPIPGTVDSAGVEIRRERVK